MVQSLFIRYTCIIRDRDFHARLIIFKACYLKLQSNLNKIASMDVGHWKKTTSMNVGCWLLDVGCCVLAQFVIIQLSWIVYYAILGMHSSCHSNCHTMKIEAVKLQEDKMIY